MKNLSIIFVVILGILSAAALWKIVRPIWEDSPQHEPASSTKLLRGTNVYETFYTNGQRYAYEVYVDGHPVGVWKMWSKKGTLVSSGICSNGGAWYGTFYMSGAGDWFYTYTNGVECTNLPLPESLSEYDTLLYSYNKSYGYREFTNEYINGYYWRGTWARDVDWSNFHGFINYQEETENRNHTTNHSKVLANPRTDCLNLQ